jgi:hypothetical protein
VGALASFPLTLLLLLILLLLLPYLLLSLELLFALLLLWSIKCGLHISVRAAWVR